MDPRPTALPAGAVLLGALLLAAPSPASAGDNDWQHYGGGPGGSHYAALAQINRGNVADLRLAWSYRTGDTTRHPERRPLAALNVTPILVPKAAGESLVLCSAMNRVIALDPATGQERWTYDPGIELGPVGGKFLCRGVAYWEDIGAPADAACRHRIFTGTRDLRLIALDARTGQPCAGFGAGGTVDVAPDMFDDAPGLKDGDVQFSAPPVTVAGVVIIGSSDNSKFWRADSPRGEVRAYDARSGALRWKFDPLPHDAADPAALGWTRESLDQTGGGNVWSMMSVDPGRGLVFLPTATAAPNNFGGHRPGDNRYANSVVALRAADGSVAWHFQVVHHDVWDIDLPAQPILVDLDRDGRRIPVVIQLTKQGLVFVLHRETGEPVFPVEERPVPTDGVPGEVLSPTQPFPLRPAPVGATRYTPADAWGFTAFDRGACRRRLTAFARSGLYEPPSEGGGTLLIGSANNWGGAAWDPERSLLVLPVSQAPVYIRLKRTADVTPEELNAPRLGPIGPPTPMAGTPWSFQFGPVLSPLFSPCTAPPWGELMAIDLRGDTRTAWRFTLGTLAKLMPVPLPLRFGTPLSGGPTVTAGGLVFIGASADEKFRAFDVETGRQLWEVDTPASAMATPMTYEVDGRQFVVVAAGGHIVTGFRNVSDYLVAYALPR
jgi:quinoprotein glucose dehydrogenase